MLAKRYRRSDELAYNMMNFTQICYRHILISVSTLSQSVQNLPNTKSLFFIFMIVVDFNSYFACPCDNMISYLGIFI